MVLKIVKNLQRQVRCFLFLNLKCNLKLLIILLLKFLLLLYIFLFLLVVFFLFYLCILIFRIIYLFHCLLGNIQYGFSLLFLIYLFLFVHYLVLVHCLDLIVSSALYHLYFLVPVPAFFLLYKFQKSLFFYLFPLSSPCNTLLFYSPFFHTHLLDLFLIFLLHHLFFQIYPRN